MKRLTLQCLVSIILLLIMTQVFAGKGIESTGVLDNILSHFAQTAKTWESKILLMSNWLFWSLAVISMTWTGILILLQRGEIQDLFKELIRFF